MSCKFCGLEFPHNEQFCRVLLEEKAERKPKIPQMNQRVARSNTLADQLKKWKEKNSG